MTVTTYAGRAKLTRRRNIDANNPLFIEAEEKVLRWLLAEGYQVLDYRKQHTYFDFRVGLPQRVDENMQQTTFPVYTLDVKCDQFAATTGRVVWELTNIIGGVMREGWGMNPHLDYVASVQPQTWHMTLLDAVAVRRLLAEDILVGDQVKHFTRKGADGIDSDAIAVYLDTLRQHGCVVKEVDLDGPSD